jgi:hexosaminidase
MIMKARFIGFLALVILGFYACNPPSSSDINIIPQPANAHVQPGSFTIEPDTRIITQMEMEDVVGVCEYFNSFIKRAAGFELEIVDDEAVSSISGDIVVTTFNADSTMGEETYRLRIQGGSSVVLQATTSAGLFYGVQTLLQLLPPEINSDQVVEDIDLTMPAVYVYDYPRFEWRGMHLDVCRHIFSVQFIEKYLDLMAMYKMNTFHWHLTEDQGWRIQIDKYPELTSIGAWRTEPDGTLYGGFYTKEQIRRVVEYAAERNITVVPEIEMPGHCVAALAAYPHLSCTGGPFEVANIWGVKKDVYCAGNEEVFEFLENVLLEVMELFPSEYIHIGGDEVPKDRWQECRKCQKRIREEGLADENELQSYFIKRMERFLNEHGRKLIGWDEILEGGLAPEATVMSWRGDEGGIEAASMGHDAVMTPGHSCYFDHYQADPATEPKAIGGLTTLKDVYHFNPIPEELNEAEQEHILGAQGNLWTEYIATPEHAEYMAVPRMLALAEVNWTRESRMHWERFLRKMEPHFRRLDIMNVNYCDAVFRVEIKPVYDVEKDAIMIEMKSDFPDAEIRYTLDKTDPSMETELYEAAFELEMSAEVRACVFVDGEMKSEITRRQVEVHAAIGKAVTYKTMYSEQYSGGGEFGLVNGIDGSVHYGDGNWQGFRGTDVDVTVDMGQEMGIAFVRVGFLQNITTWIFLPPRVRFYGSDTGEEGDFELLKEFEVEVPQELKEARTKYFWAYFDDVQVRYIRVVADYPGDCPDWHPGAGQASWVFMDEVFVE